MIIKFNYYNVDSEFKAKKTGEFIVAINDILFVQTFKFPDNVKSKIKLYILVLKDSTKFLIDDKDYNKFEKLIGEIK